MKEEGNEDDGWTRGELHKAREGGGKVDRRERERNRGKKGRDGLEAGR